MLGIHLLVVKVSVWGLKGITRYVLLCSMVYGIIAEIPCSIAHLKAHSTGLGVQIIGIGAGPAGQVLAGPLLFKVKIKFHFCKKQVMNRSTSVILRLVRLIILLYNR